MRRRAGGTEVTMSRNGRRALLAFFGLFLVFLYLPTVVLIIFSFNDSATSAFPLDGFTTGWYEEAWQNDEVRNSLWASIRVAAGTAVVATIIGVARLLRARPAQFRLQGGVSGFVLLPLVVPTVVLGDRAPGALPAARSGDPGSISGSGPC